MALSSPGGAPGSPASHAGLSIRTPSRAAGQLRTRSSASDLRSPSTTGLRRKSSHQSLQGGSSPSQTRSFYTYEVPPPPTAAQVASAHWKKELALHDDADAAADTVVILHDACYGHRFSRLRTAKTHLANIVERPERLQATTAGIAGAYVRLGERYTGGQTPILPKKAPSTDLPFKIMRTMRSTPITAPVVANVHGTRWMQELQQMCEAAELRIASGQRELERPELPAIVTKAGHAKPSSPDPDRLPFHEGDLYLCKDSLDAFQGAIGGVLDGVDAIFGSDTTGTHKAFVCIRPPGHHCSADYPSGFCWINNVHIGIEHAAQVHGLTHAAIIDFDLHHGDGSQAIAWARNEKARTAHRNAAQTKKTTIGYFSLHDINSYPCEDGDSAKVQAASLCIENAHNQSIWNVHLQEWKTEEDFWQLYEERYTILIDKTRNFLRTIADRVRAAPGSVRPKSAIFISAGFDASEHEGAGMQRHKVNVPTGFYARFTADIVKMSLEDGLSTNGRVISVLEGGYSDRALMSGVLSHLTGLTQGHKQEYLALDQTWWTSKALTELEIALGKAPATSLAPSRAIRPGDTGNYASPTQSFTNKAVDPVKMYKSVPGTRKPPSPPPKPPTPPPPDIEWPIAASELTRMLIPADRPVGSYAHEDLNEPKPVKKERHSTTGVADERAVGGRVTRGSKAKAVNGAGKLHVDHDLGEPNRRRTISNLPAPPEDEALGFGELPPVPRIEQDNRPSTSIGSPTKPFFDGPSQRSTASSRRSSLSGPQSSNSSVLQPPKVRQAPQQSSSRRPSLSRQSSASSTKLAAPARKTSGRPASSIGQAPKADPALADIDQLAARVKKITLHMPGESAPTAAPKPAKKAPAIAARTAKPAIANPKATAPPKPTKSATPPAAPPAPADVSEMDVDPIAPQSPDMDRSTAASSPFEYNVNPEFIAYQPAQPAGSTAHAAMPLPGQLTWVEPNQTESPARPSPRKKPELPVFSATGRIPFAMGRERDEQPGEGA